MGATRAKAGRAPVIAIFGGAGVSPRSAAFREAERFARVLHAEGWAIRSGGYGGIMAAVARGARANGGSHGVLLDGLEGAPSPLLGSSENAVDLYDRLRRLIEPADCYAAFAGSSGTLNEIAMLLAFYRSGRKLERPLLLIGRQPAILPALLIKAGWFPPSAVEPVLSFTTTAAALRFCKKWRSEFAIRALKPRGRSR